MGQGVWGEALPLWAGGPGLAAPHAVCCAHPNLVPAACALLQALHALWPHPPLHARLALLLSNRAAALLSQGKPLRCGLLLCSRVSIQHAEPSHQPA